MARPIRIEYAGAWYHVTCRGNERRKIFSDDADREKLLEHLAESQELYEVELHAYVLMSNHFHLLIKTRQANLQKFMQRFNTSYTMYYNRKYSRSGHLYQGRYKAIIVEADSYLLELSRYMHLNPLNIITYRKASIKEKGKILRQYRWSSYQGYVDVSKREENVSYATVLGALSGKDSQSAREYYKTFMIDGIAKESQDSLWEDVRGQAILGREGFIDWVYEKHLKNRPKDSREQAGLKKLQIKELNLNQICQVVAKNYNVPVVEICRKRSRHAEVRSILIELSRKYLTKTMSMSAIGEQLGGISISAIGQNTKRLTNKLLEDKDVKKRFEAIERELNR